MRRIEKRPIFYKWLERMRTVPPLYMALFLLIFFLPFQEAYTGLLKGLTRWAFAGDNLPTYFLNRKLEFFLTDLILILMICLGIKGRRSLSMQSKGLLIFLGVALLSIVFSKRGGAFWPYWRWGQLALPIFCLVVCFDKGLSKEVIRVCLWVLFAAAIVQVAIVSAQFALQHDLGLKHLGERRLLKGVTAAIPSSKGLLLRPYGTFLHSNILGGFLGLAFLAALQLIFTEKRGRFVLGLGAVWILCGTFLTFSRGALIGVVGGSIVFFSLLAKKGKGRQVALLVLLVLGCAVGVGAIAMKGSLKERAESNTSRIRFLETAAQMAKKKPILGHGFGQYVAEMPLYDEGKFSHLKQTVHNIYLLILAETGLLGLAAFLFFLGSLVIAALRTDLDTTTSGLLAMLAFVCWFGLVDHFWITQQAGRLFFFVTCGLTLGYLRDSKALKSPVFLPAESR